MKEISQMWEDTEKEISTIKNIRNYLKEDVFTVEREQYLDTDRKRWITSKYILTIALNGPTIHFDTDYNISVFHGGEQTSYLTHDEGAQKNIDRISNFLRDEYNSFRSEH